MRVNLPVDSDFTEMALECALAQLDYTFPYIVTVHVANGWEIHAARIVDLFNERMNHYKGFFVLKVSPELKNDEWFIRCEGNEVYSPGA